MRLAHESESATPPEARPERSKLPAAGIEPMLCIDDWAAALGCSRRMVERMRSAGRIPKPDVMVGKMPRWRPETIRRWIDAQAKGRGVGR